MSKSAGKSDELKDDGDKVDMNSIGLTELWRILRLGASKYSPNSWQNVSIERYENALQRHALTAMCGDLVSVEEDNSGKRHAFNHWHQVAINALFLAYLTRGQYRSQLRDKVMEDVKNGMDVQ